jgi:leucyl aminopeptidase
MNSFYRLLTFGLALVHLFITPSLSPSSNGYDPTVNKILSESDQTRWLDWIAELSGEVPIQTAEGEEKILTRSSFVLFEPGYSPSAFDYLEDELISLGFIEGRDYEIHTYDFPYGDKYRDRNWKNLILTFQGSDPILKDERILLVAHLDSTSNQELTLAPGADDNASGSSGLLEAAAIFRHYQFKRTLSLVWFSGEEQSRLGSEYFVSDYVDWLPNIKNVINLDMFAFDWDNDRCFEIHAGVLPGSQQIAETFEEVIRVYDLELTFDLIDDHNAYPHSDHKAFWDHGIPAVMVFENGFYQADGVCGNADRNTAYHSTNDTLAYINPDTGYSILKAAIATTAQLAVPLGGCFSESPQVKGFNALELNIMVWEPLENADFYQIWASANQEWDLLEETKGTTWYMPGAHSEKAQQFRVIAWSETGCQSQPVLISPGEQPSFMDIIPN